MDTISSRLFNIDEDRMQERESTENGELKDPNTAINISELDVRERRQLEAYINIENGQDKQNLTAHGLYKQQEQNALEIGKSIKRIKSKDSRLRLISKGDSCSLAKKSAPKPKHSNLIRKRQPYMNVKKEECSERSTIKYNSGVKRCPICGDKASTHVHYGGTSCHSCRAFFRRSVNSSNR